LAQVPQEPLERLAKLLRQAHIAGEKDGRLLAERDALASPPGQHVKQIDADGLEPGEIVGAELAMAILVEALPGHVGADQRREFVTTPAICGG
jgi:hypothetical protein